MIDDTAYKIYKQALSDHLLYHSTLRALVNQIVDTVPLLYIKDVRHKITKFGNITPKELLDHLLATYGEITVEVMNQNEIRMMAKWMTPTPIEELFDQLREAQIFATDAAIPQEITDGMLMRSVYNNIKATGLFTLPCYTWNQIKSVDQSFDTLQAHFAKADRDRQGEATASDLGYGTVNSVDCRGNNVGTRTTIGTELSALTEAITQQKVANATLFVKMMVAMNVAEKSTTKNRLPTTQGTYCWTHGRSDNVGHTSATCKSPPEGHDVEATWNNKKGGSTRCWRAKGQDAFTATVEAKLNNIIFSHTPVVNDSRTVSDVVVDTGATGTFVEMNADCIVNIQPADPPIHVVRPNGEIL